MKKSHHKAHMDELTPTNNHQSDKKDSKKLHFGKSSFQQKWTVPTFILIFALVGSYLLIRSFAAAPPPKSQHVSNVIGSLEVWVSDDFKVDKKGNPGPNPKEYKAAYTYYLKANDGHKYTLKFPSTGPSGHGPDLLSGSKVAVSGNKSGNTITLNSPADFKVKYKALPHHSPKKVAVILINFSDDTSLPQPTPDVAKQIVFTQPRSVANYYKETSYGARTLLGKVDPTGDVFGYYNIGPAGNTCTPQTWSDKAMAMAKAQGVDLTGYDNFVVYWTRNLCDWSGNSPIGANTAFINGGSFSSTVIAHEMGHSFGLGHAHSEVCHDANNLPVTLSTSCVPLEYGDPYDVMSVQNMYQTNNIHKQMLGWQQPSNIQTVTSSGDYTIQPLEYTTTGVQSLDIKPPSKGNTSAPDFFLEFRQPYGTFDNFHSSPGYPYWGVVHGVTIRQTYTTTETMLLDATPNTLQGVDDQILVGKTFNDTLHGLSITVLSVSSTGATVHVNFKAASNNATCTLKGLPPAVKPGSAFTANMTVNNTGSLSWSTADYQLGAFQKVYQYVGAEWWRYNIVPDTTWGPSSLNLSAAVAPSGTAQLTLSGIAPTTPGTYEFNWRMHRNSQDLWFGVPCSATVNVNDDVTPPSAPTNLAVTGTTTTSINLGWTAATDNVGVVGYNIYRKDSSRGSTFALVGHSFTTTYSDPGLSSRKTYSYDVTSYDAVDLESSASNIVSASP